MHHASLDHTLDRFPDESSATLPQLRDSLSLGRNPEGVANAVAKCIHLALSGKSANA